MHVVNTMQGVSRLSIFAIEDLEQQHGPRPLQAYL